MTAAELRIILDYDPVSGAFSWRRAIASHPAGSPAGSRKPPGGYICITFRYRRYYAHRLACLWMTGKWPTEKVDHRNLKPGDNRWRNLRGASHSDNLCNARVRKDSQSGLKGVHFNKLRGTWHARIQRHRHPYYLGCFSSPAAAHRAYRLAAKRYHGEFARTA